MLWVISVKHARDVLHWDADVEMTWIGKMSDKVKMMISGDEEVFINVPAIIAFLLNEVVCVNMFIKKYIEFMLLLLERMDDEDLSLYGLIPQVLPWQDKVDVASVPVEVDSHSMNGDGYLPKDPQMKNTDSDNEMSNTDLDGIPDGRTQLQIDMVKPSQDTALVCMTGPQGAKTVPRDSLWHAGAPSANETTMMMAVMDES